MGTSSLSTSLAQEQKGLLEQFRGVIHLVTAAQRPTEQLREERVSVKVSEDQHHGREREAHGSSCVGKGSEWQGLVYTAVAVGRSYRKGYNL